jgi:ribosomal protein S18 acetylase RimI-like enzyme
MRLEDQQRFPPLQVPLADGAVATVRPLSTGDAEKLGDLYEAVPREDFRFYRPYPLDRRHARTNAENALSPFEVVLVLETPEGAIGGYAWHRWDGEEAQKSVFGICIRPDCQGRGAGKALMSRLNEIAKVFGPPVMSLTVQKANPRAFDLYRKLGFQVVREQVQAAAPEYGFDAEPEYYMERRVR